MSTHTIFDKILEGAIPADKVFENQHVLAFKDVNPQAPIHVLVIPKSKVARLTEISKLDNETIANFMKGISLTATQLGLDTDGYRVVINNGKDAMQTVEYLHAHILAGRALTWPPG